MTPESVTSAMEFGSPEHLVWIWLVPVALGLLWYSERRRKARLRMIGALQPGRPLEVSAFRTITKWTMTALGLTCLVIALAKPRWGYDWIDAKQRGADIIIAVDVSKSMMAPDVSPSRLERARRKVSDLLERMNGDRVGLVAFAGSAFVQCPLTMDYSAVRLFLSYLDPSLIPTQGTDLGNAINVSLAGLFDGAPEDSDNGRAIILMTDGEDLEGRGQQAAAAAKAKGVKVYTLAIGSDEGSLIPEAGGGFLKDNKGDLVISKPNEPTLRAVAQASGGAYVRSVASDADIKVLYDQGILNDVTRTDLQDVRTKRWHERFQWFLAAAFVLLFFEPLVRDVRVRGEKKSVPSKQGGAAVVALLLLTCLVGTAQPVQAASMGSAHDLYKKKEYEAAAKEFAELERSQPDNPELTYNRAVSQFRSGDFAGAVEGFGRAAGSPDKSMQEKSWYNLGNALASQQKFKESVSAFENALKVNPENKKAQENLEIVKRLLKQQQQQQQQQQDKNQSDENQDSKEDQQQGQEDQKSQGDDQNQQQQNQDEQSGKEQQEQAGSEEKDSEDKNGEPEDSETHHNQEDSQEDEGQEQPQQQSGEQPSEQQPEQQQYSREKALELLRSVQDQIGKYKYMDPSGQTPPKDPEKAW